MFSTGRGKEILIREFGDSVYKELKNDPNVYDLAPSLYGSFSRTSQILYDDLKVLMVSLCVVNGTVCWSSDCDKPPLRTFVVEDFVDVQEPAVRCTSLGLQRHTLSFPRSC